MPNGHAAPALWRLHPKLTLSTRLADLLGVGMLGSIQNLVAGSIPRSPAALGIHIKEKETIKGRRVSDVLKQVERKYPLLGTALIDVFYPGSLVLEGGT